MKILTLAASLILAAAITGPASALDSKQKLDTALNSAIADGKVPAVVEGDTITIFGVIEGA